MTLVPSFDISDRAGAPSEADACGELGRKPRHAVRFVLALLGLQVGLVAWAFADPGDAAPFRLALHAVMLGLEAAVLMWLALTVERMSAAVRSGLARAEVLRGEAGRSRARALAAAADVEAARGRHEHLQACVADDDAATRKSLAAALERLAAGDLTFRIRGALPEKFEPLRSDFNAAFDRLQTAMSAVAGSAKAIRSGAGEIERGADMLARRRRRRTASLDDTTSTLDQITAAVRKTAEGASHAKEVVAASKAGAERSAEVVVEAVSAMSGIETSSREIGDIIGLIDQIALQTNLLALNAGVEAARAGDAGRGFAVIAAEVRALAQRSARAAKDIKTLIAASERQVQAGVALVGQTGAALERIVAQVDDIDGVVARIAVAAQEQAVAIYEVNTALHQMGEVTREDAAKSVDTIAGVHTLSRETQDLVDLIGQFELGGVEDAQADASTLRERTLAA